MQNDPKVYCGFHTVFALLEKPDVKISHVYLSQRRTDQRLNELVKTFKERGINFSFASKEELAQYGEGVNHQGVIALAFPATPTKKKLDLHAALESLGQKSLILVLDQIQDPHNLGACLRTAEGAGVDLVVLPKDNACPVNQTVTKVASGAADLLNIIYVPNLVRALNIMQQAGYWIYGTAEEATDTIYNTNFAERTVIVLGSEGDGMRRMTKQNCDYLINIPMAGQVSSLNVSVSTGIVLYEVVRQVEHLDL